MPETETTAPTRKQKAVKRVRAQKGKDKNKVQHPCRSISVEDLRVGHEIGTLFGEGLGGRKVILKSKKVDEITECPTQWRTHIHVNKQWCFDTRQSVTVKGN
jgi:hypothetical protein